MCWVPPPSPALPALFSAGAVAGTPPQQHSNAGHGCQISPPQYLAPPTLRLIVISSGKILLYFIDTMAVWVSLPSKWKLQDIQAVLNVVIAILSTLGIFTFARFCWQCNAPNIARNPNQTVRLSSLLSINTP